MTIEIIYDAAMFVLTLISTINSFRDQKNDKN